MKKQLSEESRKDILKMADLLKQSLRAYKTRPGVIAKQFACRKLCGDVHWGLCDGQTRRVLKDKFGI